MATKQWCSERIARQVDGMPSLSTRNALGDRTMPRLAGFACLLIASLCLSSGSFAAKKLPGDISLEEFTEFLKRAAGDDVEVKVGIGGFVGKVRGVDVGWIEG